jgi:hypothetical protein
MGQNMTKSIQELFEDYKKNPSTKWIQNYRDHVAEAKSLKGQDTSTYTDDVLNEIWKEKANGIASKSGAGLAK